MEREAGNDAYIAFGKCTCITSTRGCQKMGGPLGIVGDRETVGQWCSCEEGTVIPR
jgi:hypothetical protein